MGVGTRASGNFTDFVDAPLPDFVAWSTTRPGRFVADW